MSGSKKRSATRKRRGPQHRKAHGRHREPALTVSELVAVPASAGAKLAAAGVVGTATAVILPVAASAATVGGPAAGSPPAIVVAAPGRPASTGMPGGPAATPGGPVLVPPPSAGQADTAPAASGSGPAAAAPPSFGSGAPVPYLFQAKPTVRIVIIGDSYTSGEGASWTTYKQGPPQITYDEFGNQIQQPMIYPQHVSSQSPAMQAVNALQAANPGVNFDVVNVAVSGATRADAAKPSESNNPVFTLPPQLDSVRNADIIISGFAGGNDNNFPGWAQYVITHKDSSVPAEFNSTFAPAFNSGSNLADQVSFLGKLAQLAPGATIITPGYPAVFGDQAASSWSPGSPVVTSLGQNAITYSNLFGQYLNTDARSAALIANAAYPGNRFYFADEATTLQGHGLLSDQPAVHGFTLSTPGGNTLYQESFHPDPLGQRMMSGGLQPYLNMAFGEWAAANGAAVNTSVAPAAGTPAAQQNAADAHAQEIALTQMRADGRMQQLARQVQDWQLVNPDGTPTELGYLLTGIPKAPADQAGTSGQPSPAWPDSPANGAQSPGGGGTAAPGDGTGGAVQPGGGTGGTGGAVQPDGGAVQPGNGPVQPDGAVQPGSRGDITNPVQVADASQPSAAQAPGSQAPGSAAQAAQVPAAPDQPVPGAAVVLEPGNDNSYLVPANPDNSFSVPAGTTLRFPGDATIGLPDPGTYNTPYGHITVPSADQAADPAAGGPGIDVTTPDGVPLSLPPGSGNLFSVPSGSSAQGAPVALITGASYITRSGTTINGQPVPAMESATLPSGAVAPLANGNAYTVPPGTLVTTSDNIGYILRPGGTFTTPSGVTLSAPAGQQGIQLAPAAPALPSIPPANTADSGDTAPAGTPAADPAQQPGGNAQPGLPGAGTVQVAANDGSGGTAASAGAAGSDSAPSAPAPAAQPADPVVAPAPAPAPAGQSAADPAAPVVAPVTPVAVTDPMAGLQPLDTTLPAVPAVPYPGITGLPTTNLDTGITGVTGGLGATTNLDTGITTGLGTGLSANLDTGITGGLGDTSSSLGGIGTSLGVNSDASLGVGSSLGSGLGSISVADSGGGIGGGGGDG